MTNAAREECVRLDESSVLFALVAVDSTDCSCMNRAFYVGLRKNKADLQQIYTSVAKDLNLRTKYRDLNHALKVFFVRERRVKRDTDGDVNMFRLMHWNILANGLSNDGFFVNPVLDDWPSCRSSFPTSDGDPIHIDRMIDAMIQVTTQCEDEMAREHQFYLMSEKKSLMLIEELKRIRTESGHSISSYVSSCSSTLDSLSVFSSTTNQTDTALGTTTSSQTESFCTGKEEESEQCHHHHSRPEHYTLRASSESDDRLITRPPHLLQDASMLLIEGSPPPTPEELMEACKYSDQMMYKRFGVKNQKEMNILIYAALKLQAIFRGRKGRSVARLEKKYLQRKVEKMKRLQKAYMTRDMIRNDHAVINWRARWIRLRHRIYSSEPDIITLTEVDSLSSMQRSMERAGYVCGFPGCYHRPMHCSKPIDMSYREYLRQSGICFAPNARSTALALSIQRAVNDQTISDAARSMMGKEYHGNKMWTTRALFKLNAFWKKGGTSRLFKLMKQIDNATPLASEFDDDCSVIFWRRDRYEIMDLEYLDISSPKKLKSVVCVTLRDRFIAEECNTIRVITCHLASGASKGDEKKRMNEMKGTCVGFSSAHGGCKCSSPVRSKGLSFEGLVSWLRYLSMRGQCIISMDSNSRPQFPGNETVWKTFCGEKDGARYTSSNENGRNRRWKSIWDEYFDARGRCHKTDDHDPPISVNKMRGAGSQQHRKIGAHAYELIDHIWYTKGIKFLGHALGPVRWKHNRFAKRRLIPDLVYPSDHYPLVTDFSFSKGG